MMLSSPYATDTAYGGTKDACWVDVDSTPQPRVRPEAEEIYQKSKGCVGRLLVQGEPVYRPPSRQKPEPKDFGRDNIRKMRQIQSMNRRKKRDEEKEASQPIKVLPQSVKYKEVSSKVAEHVKQPPPPPRPESVNYLRSHSRTGGAPKVRGRSPSPAPRPKTAPEVKVETDANFIAHNARLVKHHKPPRPPSALAEESLKIKQIQDMQKYQKGAVPKYLKGRQQQWAKEEEERLRSIPDPDMPPGHKMMPQEERLKTLEVLRQKEKELQQELHKLPLKAETLRAKTREAEVNSQLAEVEEAIKIFSRSKVFIKIDS
ncbi:enkurin domain-containing protein 1-like isoform X2 [Acanthaster planci]|nr:enkurin domain-containing protein 1-like isoform X2 [Acanthaster planci]XP_022104760.1 enkurin domain-containing protein 1-like isoform X2 [Acanthaster planci]